MAASSSALKHPVPGPADAPAAVARTASTHAAHGRWRWLRDKRLHRLAAGLFLLVVFGLLAVVASRVEWADVGRALRRYEAGTLALACALALCSHALYACYDLIGRAYTGHRLAAWRVMTIAFVSYAFNLSLGNLIGGVGVRMRLYARMGLRTGAVVRVLGLSVVTNWLGYFALAGTLFALQVVELPRGWKVGTQALSIAGAALVLAALGYVAACALRRKRDWRVRGHTVRLPSGRMAVVQLLLAAANWAVMGAAMWVLLRGQASYPTVLAVLLLAAVAGIVTRVPAGLGVVEGIFVALLGAALGRYEVLAAVLAYRGLYYLFPLLAAAAAYAGLEWRGRRGVPASALPKA